MSVTQKQIAAHLGISQSQVAHALKGYARISEKTRQRVEEAAKELGYGVHTNNAARLLRARRGGERPRTHALAVLMGNFFEGLPLHEVPFYKPIMQGLKAEAGRRELDLSVFSLHTHRLPRIVVEGGVDGVISLYSDSYSELLRQHQSSSPVLHVGDGAASDWVLRPDDHRGIYCTTKHLIEKGHRHVAYLGEFRGNSVCDLAHKSRLEGYFQALKEGGIPVRNCLIESHIGAVDHEAGAAGMARILERNSEVTAVVCFNDTSALGSMAEIKRRGLRIPEDISVTGFDDVWEAYGDEPALTTVYFDRFEMGRRAVEAICDVVEAGSTQDGEYSTQHELLPVKLVERGSVSSPRAK